MEIAAVALLAMLGTGMLAVFGLVESEYGDERTSRLAVDPPMDDVLRFGPHQLAYCIADGDPTVCDPEVLPHAEALAAAPGAVSFDGHTLTWTGATEEVEAVDPLLVAFRDALVAYADRPWRTVVAELGLSGDDRDAAGAVDGVRLRLQRLSPREVAVTADYGNDRIGITRRDGPDGTQIGDPILDLLHLDGDPALLRSLVTDALREELMAQVHGDGAVVADGVVRRIWRRGRARSLAEEVDAARGLAGLLRDRTRTP